ncbi:MAG: RibD family protein [Cyanobacteria bacterium P01_H01_bin.15]
MFRPQVTVILAISADGKISTRTSVPARFGSLADRKHLEQQIANADGVLIGAGTVRAYGTTMRVLSPELIDERLARGQPPQPVQILVSGSGNCDRNWHFFQQPVPRWLLTLERCEHRWESPSFERVLQAGVSAIDWSLALRKLRELSIKKLAVLGGSVLVGSLLNAGYVDELWLTVCPLLFGAGVNVIAKAGLVEPKQLTLLSAEKIEQEVFLHYRISAAPNR